VQIEVARGLYMNEVTLDPNERFSAVAAHLGETLADLAREFPFGESAAPETRAAAE